MTTYTDRQKACSDAVTTIQTLMLDWINPKPGDEAKTVWNRIEEKLIALETTPPIAGASEAMAVLRDIINSLPRNKDWLDPATERAARELIATPAPDAAAGDLGHAQSWIEELLFSAHFCGSSHWHSNRLRQLLGNEHSALAEQVIQRETNRNRRTEELICSLDVASTSAQAEQQGYGGATAEDRAVYQAIADNYAKDLQPSARVELSDAELALFRATVDEFEDYNETSTDYNTLMKWANAGLLDCERFTVTVAGNAILGSGGASAEA